jgi:hypothetical protein
LYGMIRAASTNFMFYTTAAPRCPVFVPFLRSFN